MHPESEPAPQINRTTKNLIVRWGLGFGLMTALAILLTLTARDAIRASPALELAVNATIQLMPLLAAAVGAYLAPIRKMITGTACGLLSILPPLSVALLMLGYIAPLILVPMLLSLLVLGMYPLVGAAIGTLLSKVIIVKR